MNIVCPTFIFPGEETLFKMLSGQDCVPKTKVPVQRIAPNEPPLPDIGIASMPLPVPVGTAVPYPGDAAVGVPATVVEQTVTPTTQDMSKRPIVSQHDYLGLKRFIYYNADKASATDFWDVAAYERARPFDKGTPLNFKPFR